MKQLFRDIVIIYLRVIRFITKDIWSLKIEDLSNLKKRLIKYLKVAIVTISQAGQDKLALFAISLTFFTVLAVVPFIAVAFIVSNGFGLGENLRELLLTFFPDNNSTIELLLEFADNIIEISLNETFGLVSFIFFLGTVLWLILNVEKSFNYIWKIERGRSITKRFLYYFGILLVAPLVIIMFLSVAIMFNNTLQDLLPEQNMYLKSMGEAIQWLLLFGIIFIIFTIMYKYIPNVKVNFWAAISAAIITSTIFIGMQYLYMETQLFVSRLNKVYGAFAAIPLFMIWMNISWTIILIGAELSHVYQYLDKYNEDNLTKLQTEVKEKMQL